MKYALLTALLGCLVVTLTAQTVPPPTQTDEIIIDNGTSGKADPADRIRYKVTIQNTGGSNANGAQLNVVPDPRTTFVPGSFRSSPLAVPDVYACTGNVGIIVPAGSGLKVNDFDDALAGATITAGAFVTAQSGSVMISADGSFMYTPPPGFTGADMFTYTLNDGNPVGLPVPLTDMGTVTINVSDLIWFVDNSSGAATSDGRLTSPFKTLADFNAGSAAAAPVVYLEHTGTDYNGVLTLQTGERLFGEGHTGAANLSGVLPFSLAPNSKPLPNINGSRPVIVNSAPFSNGITLASNNTIRGVNVGNTTGIDIYGSNFGTLTLSEVTLSGTGGALSLQNGTLAATFTSVTCTGGSVNGIYLESVAGAADLGSTTISGCSLASIVVRYSPANIAFGNTSLTDGGDGVYFQNNSSGTRSFGTLSVTNSGERGFYSESGGLTTISGQTTITNPSQHGIYIINSTSGNGVTFANTNVTQSGGTGVFLNANAGNITFADLDISPDANQRSLYAIENTGTITTTDGAITNSGNIGIEITKSSGATPLAISLTSVSASGSSSGIILLRTSGSFAVNGSGATDGSGGTIQNMTARGASFFTATGITLKNMIFSNANTTDGGGCSASNASGCNAAIHLATVTNAVLDNVDITTTAQNGINVHETSGFQLLNSTLTGNGNGGAVEEAGVFGTNLFGTATISNTTVTFPSVRGAYFYIQDKVLSMTVSGSSFNDTQTSALGADGFEMTTNGTTNADVDINNCTFLRDKTNGVQFLTEGTSIGTIDITGCTVDPEAGVGVGLEVASNGASQLKFNIANNPVIKGRLTTILNCFAQGNSTMDGQVQNNVVTSYAGSGSGIRAVATGGTSNMRIKITNNTVSGINLDNGITCTANGGTGRMDATITGNNVTVLNTASFNIQVVAGASSSTFTNKACGNVANNIVSGAPVANYQARAATPSHEMLLQGGGANVVANWNANTNSPLSPPATVLQTGSGAFTFGATCLLPSYP